MKYSSVVLLLLVGACYALADDSDPPIINDKTVTGVPPATEVNKPETSPVTPNITTTPTTPTSPTTKSTTAAPNSTTTAPPTPITTPPPNSTTTKPTSTTTTAPPTPTSTTTLKPTVTPTNSTTTVKPTAAPAPTPAPHNRRFDGASFVGGIVLALGLVAIGFVAFKFYKARTELNYHTL